MSKKRVCPICGGIDPERVAQDLLAGIVDGLSGREAIKFAQRSMPQQVALARNEVAKWKKGKRASVRLEGSGKP